MADAMENRRIAMWSGPRNISTALMRSFENRPDCIVVDEPFYAYYLSRTGLDHPGFDQILASQPTSSDGVLERLTAPLPDGISVQYQKQMSHHILPDTPTEWIHSVTNCFLLREPRAMIASYAKTRATVTLADIGVAQLVDLFHCVADRLGTAPVVIDSDDLLAAPKDMLSLLCARLGIDFVPEMLSWPKGRRDSDGVWAPHWYKNVEASRGFESRAPFEGQLKPEYEAVAQEAICLQNKLAKYKLRLSAND